MRILSTLILIATLLFTTPVVSQNQSELDSLYLVLNTQSDQIQLLTNRLELEENFTKAHLENADLVISLYGNFLERLSLLMGVVGFFTAIGAFFGVREFRQIIKVRKDTEEEFEKFKNENRDIITEAEQRVKVSIVDFERTKGKVEKELLLFDDIKDKILDQANRFTRINYHLNQGKQFYGIGEQKTAQEHLQKIIRIEPENKQAWYYMGLSLRADDRKDEALSAFQEMLKIDNEDANACYGIALCYEPGDLEIAKQHYLLALKYHPEHTKSMNRLGTMMRLENLEEGLKYYERAQTIENNANTTLNIALIHYAQKNEQQLKNILISVQHFANNGIDKEKSPKWHYHFLAIVHLLEKKIKDCKSLYKKAITIDSSKVIIVGIRRDLDFLLKNAKDEIDKENINSVIAYIEELSIFS